MSRWRCFIHTFWRMDCDLCGKMSIAESSVYGQVRLLRTRAGYIFLGVESV